MLEMLLAAAGDADAALFQWLRAHQTPALDWLMIVTSRVTTGGRFWIAAAFATGLVVHSRRRAIVHVLLAIGVCFAITDGVAKPLLSRARPFETIAGTNVIGERPNTRSLPSGHAATSAAGAYCVSRMIPAASPLLWGIAGLVALSRVYLGVHYPADVVAGILLGVAIAVFVVGGTTWGRRVATT